MIRPDPGEWHPRMPERLDEEELADWRAGRNAVYQLAALTVGARLAVADPSEPGIRALLYGGACRRQSAALRKERVSDPLRGRTKGEFCRSENLSLPGTIAVRPGWSESHGRCRRVRRRGCQRCSSGTESRRKGSFSAAVRARTRYRRGSVTSGGTALRPARQSASSSSSSRSGMRGCHSPGSGRITQHRPF